MRSKLVLENNFGEETGNFVLGAVIPLPGDGNVVIMNGASAPTDGVTGDNIAGPGSIYIAQDTGAIYSQTGLITSPVWTLATDGSNAADSLLTGFSAGAGTVAGTDTILHAINKLAGNTQNKTVLANLLTGFTAAGGTVAATDTILQGLEKLAGNVAAHQADSTAADLAALIVDFNALLAKLQTAKLMA